MFICMFLGGDEDLQKRCQIQQETIERLENQIQELNEKLTSINVSFFL